MNVNTRSIAIGLRKENVVSKSPSAVLASDADKMAMAAAVRTLAVPDSGQLKMLTQMSPVAASKVAPFVRSESSLDASPTQTRRISPFLRNWDSEFPIVVSNASDTDMARIKQYVLELREKYGLSEREMQDVTLALACHPGLTLNAEVAMLDSILSSVNVFPDPASRSQAGRVLLATYSQLTPARAFKPDHFPQGVVESLTKSGFFDRGGRHNWGGPSPLPLIAARTIANTTDAAFKILIQVIGPWEKQYLFALEQVARFEQDLTGRGYLYPEGAAWEVVLKTQRNA
jgi:hypothetical protein